MEGETSITRREFLVSAAATGTAILGFGQTEKSPRLDPASARRTLNGHRLSTIELKRSSDRYSHFVSRGATGGPTRFGFSRDICILTTDQGAFGGAMASPTPGEITALKGMRVSDLYDVATGTNDKGMSIDLPLYDLVGNILNLPVYELLGGTGATSLPIYSSSIHFEDLEPWGKPEGISRLLRECQVDYDLGYRAFKLKLGRGKECMPQEEGRKRDIDVTRSVRERFPECKLLVDANNGYAEKEFETYLTAVAECDLYCIEEPFDENVEDYRRLRDHMRKIDCSAMIMEGETRSDVAEKLWEYGGYSQRHIERLMKLAEEGLVDLLNLDLAIVGFTRWRRIMPTLVQAGLKASPHTWAGTPRPYYCAHLAAGVGNIDMVEGIPGKATGLDYSAYRFQAGKLSVPDAPGFGIKLKF